MSRCGIRRKNVRRADSLFGRSFRSSTEFHAYRNFISEDLLEDYFLYDYFVENSLLQYWVEDIQFIANTLGDLQAPVAGFSESIDTRGFGVFGMSYGGSAAGEFCKIDDRCSAGANLDGTQFGRHWNQAVSAPFLMLYHEEHQGGNDFAYLPPTHDFWDYGVKGATHFDSPISATCGRSSRRSDTRGPSTA